MVIYFLRITTLIHTVQDKRTFYRVTEHILTYEKGPYYASAAVSDKLQIV